MEFKDFDLDPSLMQAIEEREYKVPTPIQEQVIPKFLAGKDVLGCADTGTGKTAAFAIPMLEMIGRQETKLDELNNIEGLILAPTRELAVQIGESFNGYGKYRGVQTGVVFGGVTPKRHIKVLRREPRILVATPGRLLDLVEKECVDLSHVKYFVLDEADRMLDLGMKEDVKRIIRLLPPVRQNMLLSATMPEQVMSLVHSILKNPVTIKIKGVTKAKPKIDERLYYIQEPNKVEKLIDLLHSEDMPSVLVFVRTKKRADKVCKAINISNIRAKAIHGDKSQSERQKSLDLFRNKEIKVLVATDVAARGIDIDHITHVVNLNIPNIAETYIHRIGRTGRAGRVGVAISFCDNQEVVFLEEIERLKGGKIKVAGGVKPLANVKKRNTDKSNKRENARNNKGKSGGKHQKRSNEKHKNSGRHKSKGENQVGGRYKSKGENKVGGSINPTSGENKKPGKKAVKRKVYKGK